MASAEVVSGRDPESARWVRRWSSRRTPQSGFGSPARAVGGATLALLLLGALATAPKAYAATPNAYRKPFRPHFDHTPVITQKFAAPQEVTASCLSCHPKAVSVMKTSHWRWLGEEVQVHGHQGKVRIGKKNLINNFCIATQGNEVSCTKCHIGYGWKTQDYDFEKAENIDCLVCHERLGTYVKGAAGLPTKESDLVAAAKSVGTPARENCLTCHAYGGGGQAVKHGDLDSSLIHPPADEDVHMGRHGLICIDCHAAPDHQLRGRAFSVSVEDSQGVACTDCHKGKEHLDARNEAHLGRLACQTCHVPSFARRIPTKATWDWSKAGDPSRTEDPHHYLKMKGEFTYERNVVPEYRWFNLTVNRYLAGDPIDPTGVTAINAPRGGPEDPTSRIWPFKIHRAKQPYDEENKTLLSPVTGGAGGYWTTFDWDQSIRLGAKVSGRPYSGRFGFAKTEMFWPLTHMVVPKEKALTCTDCHGDKGRMDWKALGYGADPLTSRGRP
jgi:octaheme c-type cytochrome (tetrathionate reductase family)